MKEATRTVSENRYHSHAIRMGKVKMLSRTRVLLKVFFDTVMQLWPSPVGPLIHAEMPMGEARVHS